VLLGGAAFVAGLLLPNAALAIWPAATLLVGVAFGTGMFGGEQAGEAFRFLGNQRLPPDRVWLAKAAAWSAMGGCAIALMVLGAVVHLAFFEPARGSAGPFTGHARSLGSQLLLDYVPKDVFLLLWPVYGFGVGQLVALMCRKSAVALVLSVLISVPVVGIWIPSLVTGGLKLWQILPSAALLLLATRLGLWAWTGAVLKSWRTVFGLLTCVSAAGVWLAGNLVYRAVEVPSLGQPFGVATYLADLPAPEQNGVGSLIQRVAHELSEREGTLQERDEETLSQSSTAGTVQVEVATGVPSQPPFNNQESPGQAAPPGTAVPELPRTPDAVVPSQPLLTKKALLALVLQEGWPDHDTGLGSWLDQICQGEWIAHLREAAALPMGVVEDPRRIGAATRIITNPVYQRAAQVLAARALQVQARGEHALALNHLLWALALSRNLRHHAVEAFYQQGQDVEAIVLQGLDRWLDRLGPQAGLLKRALDELTRHEELTPLPTDPIKAEYLVLRERLDNPAGWLLTGGGNFATGALEHDLIWLSLQTPWERERAARFLDALTKSRLLETATPYWQLPLKARLRNLSNSVPAEDPYPAAFYVPDGLNSSINAGQWERLLVDSRLLLRLFALSFWPQHEKQAFSLCRVRAARLKLALALYEVHEGKPAATLAELVPRYLEQLPPDPFSGSSFHYRIAKGERIAWDATPGSADRPALYLAPGVGVLWSVAPEGSGATGLTASAFADDGPLQDPEGVERALVAPDQVFVVPSWPP
jgi:hypothetical protein